MSDIELSENERLIQHLCHENVTGLVYVVGKWKEAEKKCDQLEIENKRLRELLKEKNESVDQNLKWYQRFWRSQ